MNKERIESLKKEGKIKEYKKRGINEAIADFKITLANPLGETSFKELQKKVLSSLKRQIKRDLKAISTFDELVEYASKFNFGSSSASFMPITNDKKEDESILSQAERIDDIIALMKSASKSNLDEAFKLKADITLPAGDDFHTYEAYGVLGHSFPKRFETGSWTLRSRVKMSSTSLMNLEDILSKVFYYNTLEKYIVSNMELYYRLIAIRVLSDDEVAEHVDSVEAFYEEIKTSDKLNKDWIKGIVEDELIQKYLIPDLDLDKNIDESTGRLKTFKRDYLRYMLPEFLEVTNNVELKVDNDMSAYTTHARTFETKKRINKETMEAMKNNQFLHNYKYVEIDNKVDLKKFGQLSDEFADLKRKLYIPEAKDHSFRIKRIGHYRANGIYFPQMKATVISVEDPSSFIHELGHQLDYTLENGRFPLSESFKFRRMMEKYREIVRDAVAELDVSDSFYLQWTGSSKANASYYLQPTEIFARSYELYVTEVLGIDTSFAKESYKGLPIYPLDESYLDMVASYFDDLFSFFEPSTEEEVEAVANTFDFTSMDIEEYEDVEQLSLF